MLTPQPVSDHQSQAYQAVVDETIRGIQLVSGLQAEAAQPGWIAVECNDALKARWLSEQVRAENVESYHDSTRFFVPADEYFTLQGEIKNVITAVAKTTHYWQVHMAPSLRQAYRWEMRLQLFGSHLRPLLIEMTRKHLIILAQRDLMW